MFLSSFEKLRKQFLSHYNIDNMLHLGPRTFDELSGEVVQNTAFVLSKHEPVEQGGVYYRLVDGKNCADKEQLFLSHIHGNEDGNRIYYPNVEQKNFEKIPGCPIGYWVTLTFAETLQLANLGQVAHPRRTIQCGDVVKYIHLWTEVGTSDIEQSVDIDVLKSSTKHWFKFTNGGASRRWYGNLDSVLFWGNNGQDIKSTGKAIIPNEGMYFKECIGYNRITSNGITARFYKQGILLGDATSMIVPPENIKYLLALLNSKVSTFAMAFFNPTLAAQTGSLSKVPIKFANIDAIEKIVDFIVKISKSDWNSHETAWDFQCNELLSVDEQTYMDNINNFVEDHYKETGERLCIDPAAPQLDSLAWRIEQYKQKWEHKFNQLHENEEELNRQFIDIYGLQNELTPDVPLDEITILQQGEIAIKDNKIEWHDDVLIKQLISYAVGCMMGRYSIDKPGLILANQGDGLEEYEAFVPNSRFEIDDDGIIPLMASNSDFADNATVRFKKWLAVVLGEDRLVENLNTVEAALGKTIDDFFVKDFWKYHKKMYQNRPIYWLFSSKKGAFQCIAYMHRMTPYTAEQIRTKYLLPHIEWLVQKQSEMEENSVNLSTAERRELDRLTTQITECREYHDRLHEVADKQIAFDLDDGVVVNYAKFGDVLQKLK